MRKGPVRSPILLALLFLGILGACSRPPSLPLRFAPAAMGPVGAYTTTPDGALTLWGAGSLSLRLYMERGSVSIGVRAGGTSVDGAAPIIAVSIDGQEVGRITVASRLPADYTIATQVKSTGTKMLQLTFVNPLPRPQVLLSRVLHIESVSVLEDD